MKKRNGFSKLINVFLTLIGASIASNAHAGSVDFISAIDDSTDTVIITMENPRLASIQCGSINSSAWTLSKANDSELYELAKIAKQAQEPVRFSSAGDCSILAGYERANNLEIVYQQLENTIPSISTNVSFTASATAELEPSFNLTGGAFALVGESGEVNWVDVVPTDNKIVHEYGQLQPGAYVLHSKVLSNTEEKLTYTPFNVIVLNPKVYMDSATGELYLQLSINHNNRHLKLTLQNDGSWVTTELTESEWLALGVENNFSLTDYLAEYGDFGGDGLEDIRFTSESGAAEFILLQSTLGYSYTELPDDDFIASIPEIATVTVPEENTTSTGIKLLKGDVQVTEQGGAGYTISLEVPSGKGNIRPEISASYSSLAGNGLLGLGWSLNTHSSIERCTQSLEEDGEYRGIEFNDGDALCYGGEKLRLVSGTQLADAAEYRLDSNPSIKVTQVNTGTGTYFELRDGSGTVQTFGDSVNSRATDSATDLSYQWLVSSKVNAFDQSIDYSYLNVAGQEVLLDTITYSGNTITIKYQDRVDQSTHYYLGNLIEKTKLIEGVEVQNHSNEVVRYYAFKHRLSTFSGQSLLQSVEECADSTESVCGVPTTFSYTDEDLSGMTSTNTLVELSDFTSVHGVSGCDYTEMLEFCSIYKLSVSDLNNDGSVEIIVSTRRGSTGKVLVLEKVNGQYTLNNELSNLNVNLENYKLPGQIVNYRFPWQVREKPATDEREVVINDTSYFDWNGDGVDDESPGATSSINQLADYFSFHPSEYGEIQTVPFGSYAKDIPVDFNNDGLIDRLVPLVETTYDERYVGGNWETIVESVKTYYALEVNRTAGGVYQGELLELPVYPAECTPLTCRPEKNFDDVNGVFVKPPRMSADMNGDGISDILYVSRTDGHIFGANLQIGKGFDYTTDDGYQLTTKDALMTDVVDINGDGKDDLVYYQAGSYYWRQSLSNSNSTLELLSDANFDGVHKTDPYQWADLDGDGQPEAIHFDLDQQVIRIRHDKNTENKILDKLETVDAGLGKSYTFNYKRLTDSSVYEKGTGAPDLNWGSGSRVRDIVSTMAVVATLEESTGIDASGTTLTDTTSYFYKGMKTQAGGRGTLGFEEVSSTTQSNQQVVTKYFEQQPPLDGRLKKREVKIGDNLLSSMEVTKWWQLASNGNQSTFVAPKETLTSRYYANTANGNLSSTTLMSTTTTTTTFSMSDNNYPQLDSTTLTVEDNLAPTTVSKSFTEAKLYEDEDITNWRITRPTKITKTSTRTGETTISQVETLEYSSSHGQLISTTKSPDSTDNSLYLKTALGYDDFGNLSEKTECSLHFAATCADSTVPDTSDDKLKVFRRKTFNYDSVGRYPVSIVNPDFTEQSFHSYNKFGKPTEVRKGQYAGQQGIREYHQFNSLGDIYFTSFNTGASTHVTKTLCSEDSSCPSNASFAIYTVSTDKPDGVVYLDFDGRKVREKAQLLDDTWAISDVVYDVRGREQSISKPYKSGGTRYSDVITYDTVDRKALVTQPAPLDLEVKFSYASGLLTQTTTGSYSDEVNNVTFDRTRSETFNGFDETVATTDANNNTTEYSYSALGKLNSVTSVDLSEVTQSYDIYGRVISLNDPDKGLESYTYNALGEKATYTNAANVVVTYFRNAVGQVVNKSTKKGNEQLDYNYSYDNSPQLHFESNGVTSTTYDYDVYNRLETTTYVRDGKTWDTTKAYDQYGRLFREMDISGEGRGLQYQYANGSVNRIFETKTGKAYYRATAADAFANTINYSVGNGIAVEKRYNQRTGYLNYIKAGDVGSIQEQYYRYDQLGNMRYRSDNNGAFSEPLLETMTYDKLNRLTEVDSNGKNEIGSGITSISYSDNGNILTKSDVENGATYQYNQSGSQCTNTASKHALSSVGNRTYCYDLAGNQTHEYRNSTLKRKVDYSLFSKPLKITSDNGESWFSYDAQQAMYKRIDKTSMGETTTYILGNNEVVYQTDGSYEIKRYIQDIAIHSIKDNGEEKLRYLFKDHIGSGSVITDAIGTIEVKLSFDAFGKRRAADNWQGYLDPFTSINGLADVLAITQRGFTGHQQVDHADVVHMGGRIYDPSTGRFMQADPIVQSPKDGQNYNRYSYVFNNPLSYTDPTGYACESTDLTCSKKVENDAKSSVDANEADSESAKGDVNKRSGSFKSKRVSGAVYGRNKRSHIKLDMPENKALTFAVELVVPVEDLKDAKEAIEKGDVKALLKAAAFIYVLRKVEKIADVVSDGAQIVVTKVKAVVGKDVPNQTIKDGYFEVLTEVNITGNTRPAHRNSANNTIAEILEEDENMSEGLNNLLGTDVLKHMQSGKGKLKNPPETEWHHPKDNPQVMQLLRKEVHRDKSLQDYLHKDGTGGFADHFKKG